MKIVLFRLMIVLITIATTLSFSSCDDDTPPSKSPLLVGKLWTLVSYEVNGVDVTEECQTDDETTFYSDGTFSSEIGDLTCDEFDEDTNGTWTFKANETILSLHPVNDVESDWEIFELTEGKLRISQYVDLLDAEVIVTMSTTN
jgi:hypothetical protein